MTNAYSKRRQKSIPLIEKFGAQLDEVLEEQRAFVRDVLRKTRRLHANEIRRYVPDYLLEREQNARTFLFAAQQL
jgi:hypothetical protein